jgi:uncharacterized heparinase superfamily protein
VIAKAFRYWNTIRYLRPIQVVGRLWFRAHRPRVDLRPAPDLRVRQGPWTAPAERTQSFAAPARFTFLNESSDIGPNDWDKASLSKLWRYNLHYFDDLNATDARSRRSEHEALIERWVTENPPGAGSAWEPYPTSLRIVNWIKWALAGNELRPAWRNSLAAQARFLSRRLEFHLLGNHLFTNAKALAFAGAFFEGKEARQWLERGTSLLMREVTEQILEDGGHFERSPMYHALALEDMLDLANLSQAYPGTIPSEAIVTRLTPMVDWLVTMTHPDGEIAFFNDAAIGIAPPPAAVVEYANRLGVSVSVSNNARTTHLATTGYARLLSGPAVLLIDAAPIGPDYLPGHAHADTLSFELSLFSDRVFVNGGTSRYAADEVRAFERGTAAHNTVVIDGRDSSEVWGSFRVARRAKPFDVRLAESAELVMTAAHDGYRHLTGAPVHRRTFRLSASSLTIEDAVDGRGEGQSADAFFHLHPSVELVVTEPTRVKLRNRRVSITMTVEGGIMSIAPAAWSREFGLRIPSTVIRATMRAKGMRTTIAWAT